MRQLAVIGNLALDVVNGAPPRPGGGTFHAARALRALAQPALVATKLAEEDRRRLLRPLAALGVFVRWRPAAATAACTLRYGEEGARTLELGALGDAWTVDDARWAVDGLAPRAWLQVAPLARHEFPPETLAALARGGRRILLDAQGLVRPARTGPVRLDAGADLEALRHVAVLKLAEDEAEALLGGVDADRLASLDVPEVVVTLGPRGALVWAGGAVSSVPTTPARGRVDPTGAGDAFAATYLAARAAGHPPVAAARRGCALVSALLAEHA